MKNFRTFKEELIGLARPAAAEKKWKPITTNKANKETWAVNKDAERSAAKKKVAAKRAATKEPEKKLSNYLTAKPPRSLEDHNNCGTPDCCNKC